MDIPADTQVSVTVIDNHDEQLGRQLIDDLAGASSISTFYINETKRGIPHARNRALTESLSLQADYIAFIDDDEWVARDWLCQTYEYCLSRGGNLVVSGDVVAEIPANIPADIKPLLVHNKQRPTGTTLSACATNNVLFPTAIIQQFNLKFDDSNPLAGGEDTIFFSKIASHGVAIEKCAEAIVYESIPAERANLIWLSKRKFWAGTINAWRKRQQGRSWLSILVSSTAQLFTYSLVVVILTVTGQSLKRNKALLKASRCAGEICGLFGLRVNSY